MLVGMGIPVKGVAGGWAEGGGEVDARCAIQVAGVHSCSARPAQHLGARDAPPPRSPCAVIARTRILITAVAYRMIAVLESRRGVGTVCVTCAIGRRVSGGL